MSQFNYFNDINSLLATDGELTRGPVPRWQRKLDSSAANLSTHNGSVNTSKLSISYNTNGYGIAPSTSYKTPQKNGTTSGTTGTGHKSKKTPGKSPGRKTPTANPKTPSGGDRFIPNRGTMNYDLGHYLLKQEQLDDNPGDTTNNQTTDRQKSIGEALQVGDVAQRKILSFRDKAPPAPDSHQNPLRVVYSVKTPMSTKSGSRYIPLSPERILDAPDIINDYYLNLMDWSAGNVVTVALGNIVYLWNAGTGTIEELRDFEAGEHACSLAWIQEGNFLAIGTNEGTVELWDCEKKKRLRVMNGHQARVGALVWNSYVVTSGSRDETIVHHDVRQREHKLSTLTGHTQEVCGLRWSTDFRYLASGGNDNLVNVWPSMTSGSIEPVHTFNEHQAAVRALAWCPWSANILASGGGTADRCIKFWNINNGTLINSVDSHSQVCALMWSKNYKEIISAHGYANNQLTIWKYPSMIKQADLTGHTSRVLQIALSPDGSTVMSAAADETLRLWNCFAPDPHQAKKEKPTVRAKESVFRQSIR